MIRRKKKTAASSERQAAGRSDVTGDEEQIKDLAWEDCWRWLGARSAPVATAQRSGEGTWRAGWCGSSSCSSKWLQKGGAPGERHLGGSLGGRAKKKKKTEAYKPGKGLFGAF